MFELCKWNAHERLPKSDKVCQRTLDYGVKFCKSQNFKGEVILIVIGEGQFMTWKTLQVIVLALEQDIFHGAQRSKILCHSQLQLVNL